MANGMKQTLRLSQQLVMTPQLQQAIKLLQLSRLELENMVNQELQENPVLEETADVKEDEEIRHETMEAEDLGPKKKEEKMLEGEDSFDWQTYVESYSPAYTGGPIHRSEEITSFENIFTKTTNLHDHLLWQLQMSRLSQDKEEHNIAVAIIGNINDDGYLSIPLEELAAKEGFSVERAEKVLQDILTFDPTGVGARDLRECLLAQARQLQIQDPHLETLICEYLVHLEKKNYSAIGKAMNLPLDRVIELSKVIFEMEPKPGRSFSSGETHYITPDVYVYKMNEEYVIALNEDGLPKLKISNLYKNALKGVTESSKLTKEYIQDKLRSAIWLIRSIHQRQRTIYKVTESIVKYQTQFLDHGLSQLKPMVLRDVAQDIGMHESTVSRVTTNKYVHTPQGIFELKYFFNSSVGTGDAEIASESVKERIKNMVSLENDKHPLSDQKIVEMLQAEGINIARRTVAKYREILNILPSSKRKKMF